MLTDAQIEENRATFLKLIAEINIPGCDTQGLVEWLDKGDFFTAPASTQYHSNFKGGLCQHSLNVYDNLLKLVELYKDVLPAFDKNSLLVVGLLHDISKTNFYEPYVMNKKVYSEKGLKKDNMGKFDWFAEEAFKTKDAHDRFLAGTHEENSMLIISRFIPLSMEETIAVMNHHMGMGNPNQNWDMSAIANANPLLTMLHLADMASTFVNERF